jgi:hypothetical protein
VSSTTILRIAVNRKEEILTWIREVGQTVLDFWTNWVVEPTKKVIGTIRHDESSEVSILSKRSLEGDRASLERMVVDFAVANPDGPPLDESQIANIRSKVREGDLTHVLKAYERDLQKPIMGAVTGNLVSALLIQVQKTKVDVEVAMSGIDSILKSQELLFGFIGLTPGVLVTVGVYRWLRGAFTSRSTVQQWAREGQLMMILRWAHSWFRLGARVRATASLLGLLLSKHWLYRLETSIEFSSEPPRTSTVRFHTKTKDYSCSRCTVFVKPLVMYCLAVFSTISRRSSMSSPRTAPV